MKHKAILLAAFIAAIALAGSANATVTNFVFSTSNTTLANGATYCPTYSAACGASPTVTVYGEQATSGGTFVSPATFYGVPTLNGLFTVTDSPNDNGTGIAPFNPTEGGSPFASQDGIADPTGNAGTNQNLLLLKLTNFTAGSTLSLLLQAGVTGDSFTVYTSNSGSMPTSLGGMTKYDANPINVDDPLVVGDTQNEATHPQVTGLGLTEWVAIQADCHYLLLNTLTVNSPSGVPEPRFYGLLLAGMLALAGVYFRNRRAAQANA